MHFGWVSIIVWAKSEKVAGLICGVGLNCKLKLNFFSRWHFCVGSRRWPWFFFPLFVLRLEYLSDFFPATPALWECKTPIERLISPKNFLSVHLPKRLGKYFPHVCTEWKLMESLNSNRFITDFTRWIVCIKRCRKPQKRSDAVNEGTALKM